MKRRSHFLAAAFLAAALFTVTAVESNAGVPWACPTTTVCNLSPCKASLMLRVLPPNVVFLVNVGPNACVQVNTAALTMIDSVISIGGFAYPVQAPAPVPPCNCRPTDWWVSCVTLAPGCCFDVCFDPANCRINILPAACIVPCNP